jgi:hypothetical protein
MTRFLRALPMLEVEPDLPDRFHSLLAELDRVEARSRRTPRRS